MAGRSRSTVPVGIRELARRERELRRVIGNQVRTMREDAGLTRADVARAAGIDRAHYSRIETGETGASLEVLMAIGAALGADLSVRYFPSSGPRIHDRFQAPIVEALLRALHLRWMGQPEVQVRRPVHGVIDLVIRGADDVIACEVQSELRRLEQLIRWSSEKAAALGDGSPPGTASRLLVIRSPTETPEIARQFAATLGAAYPARTSDAFDALTGADRPWPGPAILWARVDAGRGEILRLPPRGVRVGR